MFCTSVLVLLNKYIFKPKNILWFLTLSEAFKVCINSLLLSTCFL